MVSMKGAKYPLRQHTHDLRTKNPPSLSGNFDNDEIVFQHFDLIGNRGHCFMVPPNFSTFRALADIDLCYLATLHLNSQVQH